MEKIYYSFCPLKIILFFFLQNLNAQQLENIISTMEIFDIATENRSLVFNMKIILKLLIGLPMEVI